MDFVRPLQSVIPGAQGKILAVIAETTAELNLRTIARLSGVSIAHASRVLPTLVELGMVERREAPPSALFRMIPEHVASRAVLALRDSRELVLEELGRTAASLSPPPTSVIVFGSFARGMADAQSDLDVVLVRPAAVDEDDPDWQTEVEAWRQQARRLAGNDVNVVELGEAQVGRSLRGRTPLWSDVARDGIVVFGRVISDLKSRLASPP